jgi:hypothetical protein
MNPALIGAFVGAFCASLFVAAIWLIICMIIPPLKRRPVASYGIAMVLGGGLQLIIYGGPDVHNYIAALLVVVILYWQMKRAKAKLAAASQVV